MQNNQYTLEELKAFISGNIERYEDLESYLDYNNMSIEDYEADSEAGFIYEITCGTYNGATDTFTPWEITTDNLIETLMEDIHEADMYRRLEDLTDDHTPLGLVTAYVEWYEVFTIGERVFVDLD